MLNLNVARDGPMCWRHQWQEIQQTGGPQERSSDSLTVNRGQEACTVRRSLGEASHQGLGALPLTAFLPTRLGLICSNSESLLSLNGPGRE